MAGPTTTTSVLVITGGRNEHLARVITGLERATPRPDEVVVVFMNQPDGVVPATDLPVVTSHVDAPGTLPLAAARNRAARLAGGEVLVFLDVDCIPSAAAVGTLAETVRAHPGTLVMGTPRYLVPEWVQEAGAATGLPDDDRLRELSVSHPARAHLGEGPTDDWHLVWTLVLAMGSADLDRLGGFDEAFSGYGAEDTDIAFRARDAGLALRSSRATVFHQHHGVHRPPLHHFADILVNARRFRQVHGTWPMEGWLGQFRDLGLVDWDPQGDRLAVLRTPTDAEVEATRQPAAAF
ncbi:MULTISPECIES: glycosyltransferase family 2 protein [Citricoccus]|uniref:glycosyltransferase family 2 protein n=1 Tax=Citricoccus TaxID=169133 RepID=UPI000255F755|nr:glycosyltransferase [Citricoccus sp. CH26A]